MPLDFVTNPLFQIEGSDLDFKVGFKPTKMKGKKYVINKSTGDYIGIVVMVLSVHHIHSFSMG